ncbi:hypothetical protein [Pedobacter psychroterrae]|uniref:Uncharacterized protein n=1 Tax=Pedobacter psychroterrae TaxID=2530453 RepID=A0A4V2ML91_9SPHI|nr:hypothetical protein [Pedobacter psychroterrae]TCD01227.1 hypothetical protein EZ437_10750 [Pedobacter psychroterrae]
MMFKSNHRIYIEEDNHSIYQQLVKRGHEKPDDFPFASMKDVFMLAVSLGRQHNAYRSIQVQKDIFAGDVLDPKTDIAILVAISFEKHQKFEMLLDPKLILETAQSYANGGISFIEDMLLKQPGRPLNNLVNLIA